MIRKFKFAIVSTLVVAAVGLMISAYVTGSGLAQADSKDKAQSNSQVYRFADGSSVGEASSILARTRNGITATLQTNDLNQGHTYTMWWVIFNNPEECQHPVPDLTNCGEGDVFGQPLGQTPVDVSVQFAAGNIIGGTGLGNFGAYLEEGELPSGDGKVVFGSGLKDSKKAEVHLVVRDHGPAIPGMEESQITTFGGACTAETDPTGVGPIGPFECADEQFAVHMPAKYADKDKDRGRDGDQDD